MDIPRQNFLFSYAHPRAGPTHVLPSLARDGIRWLHLRMKSGDFTPRPRRSNWDGRLRFDDIVPATALATVPEAIFSAVGTILLLSTVAPLTCYCSPVPSSTEVSWSESRPSGKERVAVAYSSGRRRRWERQAVAWMGAEEGGGERWVVAGRRRARKRTERMLRRRVCAAENKGPWPFLLCFLEKEIKTEREETSAAWKLNFQKSQHNFSSLL